MNARAAVAMFLAFVLPGAGHLYLGRRSRALGFFLIIAFLFVLGLLIDGALYTLDSSGRALLPMLASFASMGSGALYFITYLLGAHGDITSSTFEYGRMFTLSAGLMNLVLVLDCYDIGMRRKE